VSKKLIIITASAGLVSFAGAFALGWFTVPSPSEDPGEPIPPEIVSVGAVPEMPRPVAGTAGVIGLASDSEKKAMTEKQLKNLVFEVREKVQEYDDKLQNLTVREHRLRRTQDTLKEDIQNLDNLRIELATIVADIKSERDKLLKTRLELHFLTNKFSKSIKRSDLIRTQIKHFILCMLLKTTLSKTPSEIINKSKTTLLFSITINKWLFFVHNPIKPNANNITIRISNVLPWAINIMRPNHTIL